MVHSHTCTGVPYSQEKLIQGARRPEMYHLRSCGKSQPAQSPDFSDPEIRRAIVLLPLMLSRGPNCDAGGERLGRTRFAKRSGGPSTLRWCGGKVNGVLESAQLSGKHETGPSCVLLEPVRRG